MVPSLKDLKGVSLLRTLCRRWQNHTLMVRWMSRIFSYLDRYYVQRHNLNSMNEVGLLVWKGEPEDWVRESWAMVSCSTVHACGGTAAW